MEIVVLRLLLGEENDNRTSQTHQDGEAMFPQYRQGVCHLP
jgi:hypothetical protein